MGGGGGPRGAPPSPPRTTRPCDDILMKCVGWKKPEFGRGSWWGEKIKDEGSLCVG